jgi:hypothetical protein
MPAIFRNPRLAFLGRKWRDWVTPMGTASLTYWSVIETTIVRFSSFAVGNTYPGIDSLGRGEVYVYRGAPAVGATPAVVLTHPVASVANGFGDSID